MPMFCRRSIFVIVVGVDSWLGTGFECTLVVSIYRSVRKVELSKRISPLQNPKPPVYDVICSWCGALIRSTNVELPEQMCLICHARMLNDYFKRLRKTPQMDADKRR